LQFNDFSSVPLLDTVMSETNVPDAYYANQMAAPSQTYTVALTNHSSMPAAGRIFVAE